MAPHPCRTLTKRIVDRLAVDDKDVVDRSLRFIAPVRPSGSGHEARRRSLAASPPVPGRSDP